MGKGRVGFLLKDKEKNLIVEIFFWAKALYQNCLKQIWDNTFFQRQTLSKKHLFASKKNKSPAFLVFKVSMPPIQL